MSRIGIVGTGAVGVRVARQLLSTGVAHELVVHDTNNAAMQRLASQLGPRVEASGSPRLELEGIDVLVVATPCGEHVEAARRAVRNGVSVVSTSDRVSDVRGLLALDRRATANDATVIVGAGFSPGLTCMLALIIAERFDEVDEVHVAKDGTGGPACARQHHRALKLASVDWRDGDWVVRPGGSGRELVWFPSPIDGRDCYRARLPEAMLLQPAFPHARRITGRRSATRQDRFTTWLPMLSPPPSEGALGAVRVEVRGVRHGARVTEIVGAAARPAVAAAIVAAAATAAIVGGSAGPAGARGLATSVEPRPFLGDVTRRGIKIEAFEGFGL